MAKETQTGHVAEPEQIRDKKWRVSIDGFKGVDADVPKVTVEEDPKTGRQRLKTTMVRMAAPRGDKMSVTTSGGKQCSDTLTRLKAQYKLARSKFQFSPASDKDEAERQMQIAYNEMQMQAHQEQLDAYKADPSRKGHAEVNDAYVNHIQGLIDQYAGAWRRMIGQGE